jgi:hypothetical protein
LSDVLCCEPIPVAIPVGAIQPLGDGVVVEFAVRVPDQQSQNLQPIRFQAQVFRTAVKSLVLFKKVF